ncbi:MAG: DUF2905 domain-containing protein [Bacillota bacterium]
MQEFSFLGRMLVVIGIVIAGAGVIFMLAGRIPWLGRLPGDIVIKKGNFTGYFLFGTSILISLIWTLFFWLFGKK